MKDIQTDGLRGCGNVETRRFVPSFPRAEGDGENHATEIIARKLREWFSTGFLTPVISTAHTMVMRSASAESSS